MKLPILWIATTRGPVKVDSITEEDPEIRSVLCLSDSFQELPISSSYDAFVRRPTGLIEQISGHGSYRVDLSGPITQGQSWQLGLATAHIFHIESKNRSFVHKEDIIWTTGTVTPRGQVNPVDEIEQKWTMTLAKLENRKELRKRIYIVAHKQNIQEIQKYNESKNYQFEIFYVPVATIDDISSYFELSVDFKTKNFKSIQKRSIRTYFIIAISTITAVFGIVKFSIGLVEPLLKLDAEGRYRELFMELRFMRQEGNWLDINGAFFLEKFLRYRAKKIHDSIEIKIELITDNLRQECRVYKVATITTHSLPDWLGHNCVFQLTIKNNGVYEVGALATFVHQKETLSPKQITKNHAVLKPGQSVTLPSFQIEFEDFSSDKALLVLVSSKPDNELVQWFDSIVNQEDPTGVMKKRIEKSGTGLLHAWSSNKNN